MANRERRIERIEREFSGEDPAFTTHYIVDPDDQEELRQRDLYQTGLPAEILDRAHKEYHPGCWVVQAGPLGDCIVLPPQLTEAQWRQYIKEKGGKYVTS
jgi:hypothetical protein